MLSWHSEFDLIAVNDTFGTSTVVRMLTRQTNSAVYWHHHWMIENDVTDFGVYIHSYTRLAHLSMAFNVTRRQI